MYNKGTQKSAKTCNGHLWTTSDEKSKRAKVDHADETRLSNYQSVLQEEQLGVQAEGSVEHGLQQVTAQGQEERLSWLHQVKEGSVEHGLQQVAA